MKYYKTEEKENVRKRKINSQCRHCKQARRMTKSFRCVKKRNKNQVSQVWNHNDEENQKHENQNGQGELRSFDLPEELWSLVFRFFDLKTLIQIPRLSTRFIRQVAGIENVDHYQGITKIPFHYFMAKNLTHYRQPIISSKLNEKLLVPLRALTIIGGSRNTYVYDVKELFNLWKFLPNLEKLVLRLNVISFDIIVKIWNNHKNLKEIEWGLKEVYCLRDAKIYPIKKR